MNIIQKFGSHLVRDCNALLTGSIESKDDKNLLQLSVALRVAGVVVVALASIAAIKTLIVLSTATAFGTLAIAWLKLGSSALLFACAHDIIVVGNNAEKRCYARTASGVWDTVKQAAGKAATATTDALRTVRVGAPTMAFMALLEGTIVFSVIKGLANSQRS